MKPSLRSIAAVAAVISVAACSGGSSDAPAPAPSAGTNPQPVISVGPITNFGSVVVNGVRYNTDNAVFSVSGQPGTQADLSIGHIVSVKGTIDDDGENGTADEVFYDESVEGPVSDIDLANGTLVVLGQTVLVVADTSFDDDFSPESLEGISVGDIVEVSGQFDGEGNIVASRIEREDADDNEFEVYGFVAALDTAGMTFSINDLVVDYSTATLDDFPGGQPADGDFVEVKGTQFGPNGELIATEVDFESPLPDYDDDDDGFDDDDFEVEIEGYITRFESAQDFDVAGQPVTTTDATRYEDGLVDDLALNIKVEVEGRIDANGVLVADEIEFENEGERNIRIAARVDSVDAANDTIVMLGIPVRVDVQTRMEDDDDDDEGRLTVADILVGDYLEIRGTESPADSGEVLASRLEREDDEDDEETILQGFVDSVTEPTLQILGVTIETNGNTEFESRDDAPISASAFFSSVAVGDLVKAKGFESSDTTLVAEEVEFEDDDD
ncbi:MAG: DUF5666 domain-containing protein [Pseudomonadota bacterium]